MKILQHIRAFVSGMFETDLVQVHGHMLTWQKRKDVRSINKPMVEPQPAKQDKESLPELMQIVKYKGKYIPVPASIIETPKRKRTRRGNLHKSK